MCYWNPDPSPSHCEQQGKRQQKGKTIKNCSQPPETTTRRPAGRGKSCKGWASRAEINQPWAGAEGSQGIEGRKREVVRSQSRGCQWG